MLKIGTLFSGIGTPELSLKHLNIEHETVFACEIDKYARKTYLANNQEPNTFYEDVTKLDANKYLNKIDGLIGGFPCQAFSIAGKQLGFEDTRGTLFFDCARIVKESQPKFFIFENVKGLVSHDKPKQQIEIDNITYKKGYPSHFNKEYDGHKKGIGKTLYTIETVLLELGYPKIYWEIVNTKDYGIPQNRERIYIVGFKDNVDFHFQEKQELKLRLKDMLEDSVDSKYLLNQTNVNFMNTLWGNDTRWKKMKNPIDGCAGTICATHSKGLPRGVIINNQEIQEKIYKDGVIDVEKEKIVLKQTAKYNIKDNYISINGGLVEVRDKEVRVREAVKRGYTIATEGDSINLSVPSSKTRRARVGKQVAQTLDTACNQAVFSKNKLDTNLQSGYNGVNKKELEYEKSTLNQEDTIKILRVLWGEAREKAFKKWGLGINDSFQQEEILQQRLYGKEFCKNGKKQPGLFISSFISETDKQAFYRERFLPTMWSAWKSGCSSYGQGLSKQQRGEFDDFMQKLSYENSQTEINMQIGELPNESKRSWILRKALSEVQEMGRSYEDKKTEKCNYIFRKLTERECFRLQGFDDSFIFPEKMSSTQLYKQAGNSMSRNITDMILTQVLKCYTKYIEVNC